MQSGLVAAVLMMWGWQTGMVPAAAVMALLMLLPLATAWRWNGTPREFNRLADVGSVLSVLLLAKVMMIPAKGIPVVLQYLQLLPLAFFPLVAAARWSPTPRLPLSVILYGLRRTHRTSEVPLPTFDPLWLFMGVLLLAAAIPLHRNPWYYPVTAGLVGWGLLLAAPRRGWAGVVALAIAAGGGYYLQQGIHRAQEAATELFVELFSDWFIGELDPYRSITNLGEIKELKVSGAIVMRVEQGLPLRLPLLLQEASYNLFRFSRWHALGSALEPLVSSSQGDSWPLSGQTREITRRVVVYKEFPRGRGLLPLPGDAQRIERLPATEIKASGLGAVRMGEGPEFVGYAVGLDPAPPWWQPPTEVDLQLPVDEKTALDKVVKELGIARLPPQRAVQVVERWFQQRFTYSVELTRADQRLTPIADFLLNTKSGHCEYFATAAALLLRTVGIPSRYAVGFSVQEYDETERKFLVRSRHAHAWTLGFWDGRWHEIDPTPAAWFMAEAAEGAWWQPADDLIAWLQFRYRMWSLRKEELDSATWLGVVGVLTVILVASILRRGGVVRGAQRPDRAGGTTQSPLAAVERYWEKQGLPRNPGEPVTTWQQRLPDPLPESIIASFQRVRFDPALPARTGEERQLQDGVREWLRRRNSGGAT